VGVLKEKFEDTKGVIRGVVNQLGTGNTMVKKINNDLQNTTQKTTCQAARNPLKTMDAMEG
jgi:hypothetical protein